jgi:hypothetical protein
MRKITRCNYEAMTKTLKGYLVIYMFKLQLS